MPSPSLTALSAYIEKDFEVRVIDCTVQERPWAALEEAVRDFKPAVVGITAISTSYIYDAMNAAYLVKLIDPSVITIGGGVHMSLMPEETLQKCPSMDYIAIGEGELTLMEFLKAARVWREGFRQYPRTGIQEGRRRPHRGTARAYTGPGYASAPGVSPLPDEQIPDAVARHGDA